MLPSLALMHQAMVTLTFTVIHLSDVSRRLRERDFDCEVASGRVCGDGEVDPRRYHAMGPAQRCDVWHDRAAFHFLTEAADRTAYVECLAKALRPGGHVIIALSPWMGPEQCSGLPVVRYDAALLSAMLGDSFALGETRRHDHRTPIGGIQHFQFSVFSRRP